MGKALRIFKRASGINKIAVLVAMLFLLTGCVGEVQERQHMVEKPIKDTLTLSVDAGVFNQELEEFIQDFSERHQVEIIIQQHFSGSVRENEVQTELLAGKGADIILFSSGGLFKTLDPKQHFVDISGEEFAQNYIESFKSAVSVGDQVFGLPIGNADAVGFIYNKRLYEQLGLSEPVDWAHFQSNLISINQAGITPILTPFKDQWLTQYYLYVAEVSHPDNKAEEYRELLRKVDWLKENNHLSSELLTTSLAMGLSEFGRQESAHFLGQFSFIHYLTDNHIMDISDIGFFSFPNETEGFVYILPSSFYINQNSDYIEISKEFFREYYETKLYGIETTVEQPGVFQDSKIQPDRIIYEQQMDFKLEDLPELLLDFFTDRLTADELIHQILQRNKEQALIF